MEYASFFASLWNWAFQMAVQTSGLSLARQEGLRVAVERLKEQFGFDQASVPEGMLIEHLALGYLRLNLMEEQHVRVAAGQLSIRESLYFEKRLSAGPSAIPPSYRDTAPGPETGRRHSILTQ